MYDIAISYCVNDIIYVQQVVDALKENGLDVFFDRYNYDRLVCCFLHEELYKIFTHEAQKVVLFLSKEYLKRPHPMWEARSAIAESVFKPNYIIVVLCDDITAEEISDSLCINRNYLYIMKKDHTPKSLADLITKKL